MTRERLHGLNLNLLLTIDVVLRHRNLTKAAADLAVTQGAVSQSLARLREFFNDPLLVKVGNGMEMTALGEALQCHVAEILSLIDKTILIHEAFNPADAYGTLNICLTDMGEFALLPPLISRLQQIAPKLDVHTHNMPEDHLVEAMAAGRIDLAIAGPLGDVRELKQQKVFEHELVALVHRDCPLPDVLTVEDYVSLPHIVLDSPMVKRSYLDLTLANFGVQREIRVRTANALVQPFLLSSHPELVATVTRLFAETAAPLSNLRVLRFDFQMPRIPVYQYWHRRFDNHGMSLWLRALIKSIAADLARP
jgi:DNA-binding transcriptional LysR family regulator